MFPHIVDGHTFYQRTSAEHFFWPAKLCHSEGNHLCAPHVVCSPSMCLISMTYLSHHIPNAAQVGTCYMAGIFGSLGECSTWKGLAAVHISTTGGCFWPTPCSFLALGPTDCFLGKCLCKDGYCAGRCLRFVKTNVHREMFNNITVWGLQCHHNFQH